MRRGGKGMRGSRRTREGEGREEGTEPVRSSACQNPRLGEQARLKEESKTGK